MTQEEIKRESEMFKFRCILNMEEMDMDSPVYRVYSSEYLLELFRDRKNALVKPSLWDDPFENVIFQQTAQIKNGQHASFAQVHNRYYGQCWTLNGRETDALWRIYSHNKNGIRVKTTIRKLFDNFYNVSNRFAMVSYFIGKINYLEAREIQAFYEDPHNLKGVFDVSGIGAAQTLLVKRPEFDHEKEIRLLYRASETEDVSSNVFKYDFSPKIIEELLFDPRYDQNEFQAKIAELQNLGFSGKVEKSGLYKLPNFNLRMNF